MKIRRSLCAALALVVALAMAPAAWADTEETGPESATSEQIIEETETVDTESKPAGETPADVVVPEAAETEIAASEDDPIVINKADISEAVVTLAASTFTYSGAAVAPEITVTLGETTLTAGQDYTVSYETASATAVTAPTKAGSYKVIVTGAGDYTGTASAAFTINPRSVSGATVSAISAKTYRAAAWMPAPIVKVGGVTLTKGTDYTLSYTGNTLPGTAKVIITGKGNYTGTRTVSFTISKRSVSEAGVTYTKSYIYNGTARKPSPTVKVTLNGKLTTLKRGADYTVTYSSNIKAGTAKMTITGTGNFKGSKTVSFTIKKKSLSKAKVTGLTYYKYTGKVKKPVPTVKLSVNGKTKKLKKGTDFTVTYKNNVKAGTATIYIKGRGNYSGTIKKTFRIYKSKTYYEKRYAGTWTCYKVYDPDTKKYYTAKEMGMDATLSGVRDGHKASLTINGAKSYMDWKLSGSTLVLWDEYGAHRAHLNGSDLRLNLNGFILVFKK